ncbi:uncharacterized protein BCR38DRAFT_357615 [Pseudomassariella vexata]|uniref:Uncharacterized protein n=1 Tax=Pseudomassariella vexata TaxID=1141098 RepID=A0A1Y2D6A3_9PEZI|nr:uncharacterized protein BCR38DRAFT_357615 [Pseudomassariella vexata]ORY54727.1 hypothetical protein BCR38DRAFT_357615 [Pseudomassariella vexata]
MHRYMSALHITFFDAALKETAYAFSRKILVDTSLKIWAAASSASPMMGATYDLSRLVACGSGFYRTLQEEQGLGPLSVRADLVCVVEDAKTWCLRCIESGETNIKGYLHMCIIGGQIDGLRRGRGEA